MEFSFEYLHSFDNYSNASRLDSLCNGDRNLFGQTFLYLQASREYFHNPIASTTFKSNFKTKRKREKLSNLLNYCAVHGRSVLWAVLEYESSTNEDKKKQKQKQNSIKFNKNWTRTNHKHLFAYTNRYCICEILVLIISALLLPKQKTINIILSLFGFTKCVGLIGKHFLREKYKWRM